MDSSIYEYDEKIRPIDKIEFTALGNAEVRRRSAFGKNSIGIDIADLYDNMEPKRGGLIDSRMGTTDKSIDCATCGLNATYCPGHEGHIVLAEPVFHIGYIATVKKILSCICLRCSKLLLDKYKTDAKILEMLKNKSGKARFNEIRNLTRNVTYCQRFGYGCGTPVAKIKLETKKKAASINIIAEYTRTIVSDSGAADIGKKQKERQILTAEDVWNILKNISDTDCMIMGIDPKKTRPEMLIYKVFPVPPVQVRPSVKADFMASSTMEDDITHKLADIVKVNQRIRKYKESVNDIAAKYRQDNRYLLQYHVFTFYDNESMSMPKAEMRGKQIKGMSTRIKTKHGRIRGSLMGKRVNFSARTVITPDPTIEINELGLPIKMAMTLTFPEIVTPRNIKHMEKLVKAGPDKYPGANLVFQKSLSGKRTSIIHLRYRKEKVILRYGDIVERHLVNGDYVLLNRQPTLHKLSMMGHKIKVINDPKLKTLRLNLAIVTGYNADFDGDEMNIFVPQSKQTMMELEMIADAKTQFISPRLSLTIIGTIQDGLLGAYNLTNPKTEIDWKDAMNIMAYTKLKDYGVVKKNRKYSGKELFSMIVPPKINIDRRDITIKNGIITKGRLNKSHLGPLKNNSIVHLVWNEYGAEMAKKFVDDSQRLVNNYNLYHSFSVGIGDMNIPIELEKQLRVAIETKKLEINYTLTDTENNPDLQDAEVVEESIHADLSAFRSEKADKLIINNMKKDNNFYIMLKSGSKGKAENMGQMGGCLGQQTVEGKRVKKRVNGRSLPFFHQNNDSADARGFIGRSFLSGLSPKEFFFHNMSSREGLIDTAIKTAESGYIQRRLVKSGEDMYADYDSTVRAQNKTIIQFVYGDNGVDTTKQYEHELSMIKMGNKELADKYKFSNKELSKYSSFGNNDNNVYFKRLLKMRDMMRESIRKQYMDYIVMHNTFMLPVNFTRIINNLMATKITGGTKLEPDYVIKRLDSIVEYKNTQVLCMSKETSENKNSLKVKDEKLTKTVFLFTLHEYLSPKICIKELGMNKETFDKVCDDIIEEFNKAIIEPGEMVGILAAQSIGEPVEWLVWWIKPLQVSKKY